MEKMYHVLGNMPSDNSIIHTKQGKLFVYQDMLEWTIKKYDPALEEKPWRMEEIFRTDSGAALCAKLDSLNE